MAPDPYYRHDLAVVHHFGFAGHAANCAPGIVDRLAPVRDGGGLVLELGCGTGLLTQELVAAGHRVLATDASPAMLDIARDLLGDRVEGLQQIRLPDDPLPDADAVVAIGHPLNYLPDAASLERAVVAMAEALRPGGLLLFDVCDVEWGRARRDEPDAGRVGDDWAIITRFDVPSEDRFVRDITTFVPNGDGTWRRDDEHHENVLVDAATIPDLLAEHGVEAECRDAFGAEQLPVGLKVIAGRRPAA